MLCTLVFTLFRADYLYRAVDKFGNIIDFYLSKIHNRKAAKRFLGKALKAKRNNCPYVITVDKNQAYSAALVDNFTISISEKFVIIFPFL